MALCPEGTNLILIFVIAAAPVPTAGVFHRPLTFWAALICLPCMDSTSHSVPRVSIFSFQSFPELSIAGLPGGAEAGEEFEAAAFQARTAGVRRPRGGTMKIHHEETDFRGRSVLHNYLWRSGEGLEYCWVNWIRSRFSAFGQGQFPGLPGFFLGPAGFAFFSTVPLGRLFLRGGFAESCFIALSKSVSARLNSCMRLS
jgi:hypothetical protein